MSKRLSEKAGRRTFATENQRWTALEQRDPNADGRFVYGVTTTGIYCRPTCPSRLAHREHVRFHEGCLEAEQAGFRPCLRCQPREATQAQRHAAAVAIACRSIEKADSTPSLAVLAESAGLSPFHFHRLFKNLTGITPKAYADAQRIRRVRGELRQRGSVTEAIYRSGFNSSGRFYDRSRQTLGMTPVAFRSGGAGIQIQFAVKRCWLGRLLVGATGQGVCAILLGENSAVLRRALQEQFPGARLVAGDGPFQELVKKVVRLAENPAANAHLPLDIRGTAFQQRVWQALRRIPAGSTVSYSELAQQLGQPRAARAVAGACAANSLAIAVPCHRVVRRDGALAGYRWGVERKRRLLAREAARRRG